MKETLGTLAFALIWACIFSVAWDYRSVIKRWMGVD